MTQSRASWRALVNQVSGWLSSAARCGGGSTVLSRCCCRPSVRIKGGVDKGWRPKGCDCWSVKERSTGPGPTGSKPNSPRRYSERMALARHTRQAAVTVSSLEFLQFLDLQIEGG
uniref:Secreted protein n=1 Tax=Bursaphelenchus xylophilus TaxID=6326 RepID=A0A1I7S591_BURXY